jgi:enamine deaminase RidA (YjgF/YER057c/UK114 family)
MFVTIGRGGRDVNATLSDMSMKTRRKLLTDSATLIAASSAAAVLAPAGAHAAAAGQDAAQAPSRLRHLSPAGLAPARGYSHVVDVSGGRTIFISGQVALDKSGAVVGGGDMRAQAKQVFENLKTALDAAGASFADVVKLGFYVTDASQVQQIRDVRDTYINTDAPPASTLVEVRRLVRQEFLIEVDAIANVAR